MTEATESTLGASPGNGSAAPDAEATSPATGLGSSEFTDTFPERYAEAVAKVNAFLGQIDWLQLRSISLTVVLVLVATFVLLLTKGLLDTVSLIPIVPGLLQLLGLVVLSRWALRNLVTREKRQKLYRTLENTRKEYMG